MVSTIIMSDGKRRCAWCAATAQYIDYHDHEWGYPVHDDQKLFEKLCLESFQSGLSWRTILEKRENFRSAFQQFDFHKMARYTQADVARLLQNTGIVRHRGKIEAVINNAQRACEMIEAQGSLAHFFWQYAPKQASPAELTVVAQTVESQALSRALKKLGWKFVGPTTAYAFMQSMGMVNDHARDCDFFTPVETARQKRQP